MLSLTAKLLLTSIISFALGWLTKTILSNNNKKEIKLAEELQETKNELHNYQLEISHYFENTANLFNNLSLQYKNLYDHLADSAKKLCKTEFPASTNLLKHEHYAHWQKTASDQELDHNWHPTYFEARDAKVNQTTESQKPTLANIDNLEQKPAIKAVKEASTIEE